jgi:hypothetical protein
VALETAATWWWVSYPWIAFGRTSRPASVRLTGAPDGSSKARLTVELVADRQFAPKPARARRCGYHGL